MRFYPAIDLLGGKCVRLQQGNFSAKTVYSESPFDTVAYFQSKGLTYLHLVDLDGAKNSSAAQVGLVTEIIKKSTLKIQVGGGIRSEETIERLLLAGADRIVIGSLTITNQEQVQKWLERFGREKIVLAFDINWQKDMPIVYLEGWQLNSELRLWDVLARYECYFPYIICTDISRDGMLSGPNFSLYQECAKRFPNIELIASGGISNLEDIIACRNNKNIHGVIVGKALYENKISLDQLLC